jgi:hypothetical protein
MIKQTAKLRLNFSGFNAETPFDYSKEHGIAFSRLVRNLDDLIKKENLKYITLPFANKVTRILKHGHEFNNKQMMFACSANRSNISIGEDEDTLPFCHREFFANADEPVQKFIKEHYLIHDNQNIAKQRYITSCYTDFPKLKLEYVIIMCKELAECGLIDESYSNYDKAYLLAMVILIPTLCFPAPLTLYASPYISCIGNIKLMANGAFDYLMREAASA